MVPRHGAKAGRRSSASLTLLCLLSLWAPLRHARRSGRRAGGPACDEDSLTWCFAGVQPGPTETRRLRCRRCAGGAAPDRPSPSSGPGAPSAAAPGSHSPQEDEDLAVEDEDFEVWQGRAIRQTIWQNRQVVANWGLNAAELISGVREFFQNEESQKQDVEKSEPNALGTLVLVAVGSAVLFRVGGRVAVLNMMGLDALQDSEMQQSIEAVLNVASSQELAVKLLLVLAVWIVAKVFLLDFISFPLAVADGIIFGGVLEGTLVSCIGATLGSSISFFASRTLFYEKARARVDGSPGLRAMESAVADKGAQAVFTLRLAPILPIPLGGYAYIYGLTRLPWQDFALGTFAGSAKPYFLDAYLGCIFKEIAEPPSADNTLGDVLLFTTIVATLTAGTFASELAIRSFAELSSEVETYDEKLAGARGFSSMDIRSRDPLLRSATFVESLAFWGVKPTDFPGLVKGAIETLTAAQQQCRNVYAEQWLLRGSSSSAGAAACGGILRLPQPEELEAEAEALPLSQRFGLEVAQAVLTLPVFFEAVGTYSNPDLRPKVVRRRPRGQAS